MTDHEHEWDLWEIFSGKYHCKVEGCRAKLTRQQAEAILNKHAAPKRESDAHRLKNTIIDLIATMKNPAIRRAKTVHQMCSFLDAWILDLEQALAGTQESE